MIHKPRQIPHGASIDNAVLVYRQHVVVCDVFAFSHTFLTSGLINELPNILDDKLALFDIWNRQKITKWC